MRCSCAVYLACAVVVCLSASRATGSVTMCAIARRTTGTTATAPRRLSVCILRNVLTWRRRPTPTTKRLSPTHSSGPTVATAAVATAVECRRGADGGRRRPPLLLHMGRPGVEAAAVRQAGLALAPVQGAGSATGVGVMVGGKLAQNAKGVACSESIPRRRRSQRGHLLLARLGAGARSFARRAAPSAAQRP